MANWWLARWQRGTRQARAPRAPLRVELLEERNLLSGLKVVPSPTVPGSQLVATAAIAANDIWAVGNILSSSTLTFSTLAEHFNGTSWSVVPTPSFKDGGLLGGVAGVASNDVWAVGEDQSLPFQPLIEHWNGTSWSVVSSPPLSNGGGLGGVTAVSSNDVWAVGGINNTSDSLVEHWDGTSWSIVSSPAFTGQGGLSGIAADASKDVWAVGNASGTPTVLHWDGTSWSQGPLFAGNAGHSGVTALAPTNVWVVGSEATSLKHVRPLIRHWDGTIWAIVPSPDPDPDGRFSVLNGIAAISASDIWAVGQVNGQTLTEHFNGTDWKIINSPNPGAGGNELFGVTALSTGTVVAVGESFDSAGVSNGLILSNSSSSPAAPATMAVPATTGGTTTTSPTRTMPDRLDTVLVDQFFAAAGKADRPLSLARHISGAQAAAGIWDLDFLPEEIGLLN